MRIGINAEPLTIKEPTGIQYYSRYLIDYIAKIDRNDEFYLFYPVLNRRCDIEKFYCPDGRNIKRVIQYCPIFSNHLWLNWYLQYLMIRYRIDVFHSLNYYLPRFKLPWVKMVVTVHDLSFFHSDNFYELWYTNYLKRCTIKAVEMADRVIAVSNSVKNDIINSIRLGEEKVSVIYHGIEQKDPKKVTISELSDRYGIKCKYLISIGGIGNKKNHINIVKAFAKLKEKVNNIQLVIVGGVDYGAEKVYELVSELGLGNCIRFMGYKDREDVDILLSNAELLLFPSQYEGFGFPILEAFQLGVPVIASKTTSMPEIADGAAVLVDPNNIEEIVNAICEILQNPQLKERLVSNGFERVRAFSWEKSAMETIEIYHSVWKRQRY